MAVSESFPQRRIHRVGSSGHVREVAAIVAEAFSPQPASAWLVPDPVLRADVLAEVFTILVSHALDYGHVDRLTSPADPAVGHPGPGPAAAANEHAVAVAVWLHNESPSPPPPNYDRRLRRAAGIFTDRFARLDATSDVHRPQEPHHYLALLAVRPDYQGLGISTDLLAHHHARLDALGLPGYVEAAGLECRRLYVRHGYHQRAESFGLPNGARFYPMWRDPTL